MLTILRKLRMAPRILYYKVRAKSARDYGGQWDSFWSSVEGTGKHGEVLWDADDEGEFSETLGRIKGVMSDTIPVLDLGCGNGSWTKVLSHHFPKVIGVDVSSAAISLARAQSQGISNVEYRVGNLVDPEVADSIHQEFGDVNIFMRGVFHVICAPDRPKFAGGLAKLLGSKGVLHQIETDGTVLEYMLARPDGTATGLPRPMEKVIEHGIIPAGFGPADQHKWFDEHQWEVLESGEGAIHTIRLPDGRQGRVPAYTLTARLRRDSSGANRS